MKGKQQERVFKTNYSEKNVCLQDEGMTFTAK
jgi:hypothetical protein